MPELPEVHTITKDLKKYAVGATISELKIRGNYGLEHDFDSLSDKLPGFRVESVDRVAKNIVIELSSKHYIQMHLAMTGRLLLRSPKHPKDPHERVIFTLNKNDRDFELRFCDMRMFGKVAILDVEGFKALKKKYGPEPLQKELTPKEFLEQLQSKNTNIKNVLLDQKIIAGLGNVYATDALWIAGIHPETRTPHINLEQAEDLLEASREILAEGIRNRGISMSDYVDLFGKKGKQQEHFRVYGKEVCSNCGGNVEFMKLNGRGTYFCPKCQPK